MCQCGLIGAGHIPVTFAILLTFTVGLTYVLSVWKSGLDPFFPYISDTGTYRPESCIFGLLLNLASFLALIIIHLRYRLIRELNRGADVRLQLLNKIALALGILSAFGMMIVANFQETAVLIVHMIGAFTCFGVGLLYSMVQTVISMRMNPLYNGKRIVYIRAIITSLGFIAFVTCVTSGVIASHQFNAANPNSKKSPKTWNDKTVAGYPAHLVSTFGEWFLALSFVVFLLSFSRDFEKMRVKVHVEPIVSHLDESPIPSRNNINNYDAITF